VSFLRATLTFGLIFGLGVVTFGGAAQADKIKDVTCEQFLAMDEDTRERVAYWIEGAEVASSSKAVEAGDVEVGYDASGNAVVAIVTACEADKKASLWEKIKARLHMK